jgi:hypothetical protein
MPSHKSEYLKISAVEYYLDSHKTWEEICNIFKCSVRSLIRWVERINRKLESYKIIQEQVK